MSIKETEHKRLRANSSATTSHRFSLQDASEKSELHSDLDRDVERIGKAPQVESPRPDDASKDLVDFDGPDDLGNPKNWSRRKRWFITTWMGLMTFCVTVASSIWSIAIAVTAVEFDKSETVMTLGVSLFLLGFVFGPIVFGPMSEVFGRKPPLFIGYAAFAIFQIPVAVAQNVETIMLGRFLGGFAASAPLAIVGGALADIWDPIDRAFAVCVFAGGAFVGPVAGPIGGGFIVDSYLGWRWTAWMTLIISVFFGTIGLITIPETSAAKILQTRAKNLRYKTRNWALHAKANEQRVDIRSLCFVYLMRPFVMFFQEPILFLLTAYMSFLYGMLYLFFEAYPVAFQEQRGWSDGVGSLPFLAFTIGYVPFGVGLIAWSTHTNFRRAYEKHGKPVPEERLPPMIAGAILLPIGLFWFAWTSDPNITWVPQVLSGILIGMGELVCFWQGVNYMIDCYGFYSNSAMAINTFVRSFAGAGFPLFAPAMYHNLGVAWATSLLGFLCVAFMPVPVLFYIYGARIRARSKFVPT